MSFSLLYLLNRCIVRIGMFLRDWYVGGFKVIGHATFSLLASLDQTLALFVTLRMFWKPLYGDHTIIGHILGIIFRIFRILIACALYLAIIGAGILAYAAWALAPFLLFAPYSFN